MSIRSRSGAVAMLSMRAALSAHCGSSSAAPADSSGADAGGSRGDCGTRTGMRGKTSRTLTVNGTARSYIAYLPKALDGAKSSPFVFVFHGAGMDGSEMYDITQYAALADSEGIAVAFLDGQATSSASGATTLDPWNVSDDGAAVCGAGTFANNSTASVDFAFMNAVKGDLAQDQCIDAKHVFATGFSMGGYFTHHIGCDRTDVRADAPHSGATIASLSSCKTGHVPVIIFHGLADPLIAPGCDDPNSTMQSGFPPSATLWAQKNGCGTTYSTVAENGASGSDGQCYVYDGCPADGQVELCTFAGMGHCWAGGDTANGGATFACPGYVSATQLEWDFFKQHAW